MTIKTGIEVTGKFVAGNIVSGARAARSAVESIGAGAARAKAATVSAFKAIGGSMTALNQGLEVGKKAAAALSAAYAVTVAKALDLRAANDPAKKSLEDAGKAADRLGVAIGDAVLPYVQALATAMTPVINKAVEWLNTNRQLIASNLVPWMVGVGKTLTSVVATGALLASKAYYGWAMAIGVVKDLASQAEAAYARDQAAFIRGTILRRQMTEKARAAYVAQAAAFDAQAASATAAANKYAQDVGDAIAKNEEMERSVDAVAASIQAGIGQAGQVALAAFSKGAVLAKTGTKAMADELDGAMLRLKLIGDAKAAIDAQDAAAFDARIARQRQETQVSIAFNSQIDAIAKSKREKDTAEQSAKAAAAASQQADTLRGISQSIASSGVGAIGAVISGAEEAGDALLGFFAGIGESIASTIAEAAAAAAASGIFNLLSGGIFGSVFGGIGELFGMAKGGMIGEMPRAATGGLVRGGSAGIDSVPVLTMPGELITSTDDVRKNLRAGREPGDGGSRPQGGSVTVNASAPTFMPESSADFDRRINNALIPAIRRLTRAGVRFT